MLVRRLPTQGIFKVDISLSFLHFFFWIVVAVAAVAAALVVEAFFFALISSPPVGERVDAVFLDQNSKWNVACPFLVALCR